MSCSEVVKASGKHLKKVGNLKAQSQERNEWEPLQITNLREHFLPYNSKPCEHSPEEGAGQQQKCLEMQLFCVSILSFHRTAVMHSLYLPWLLNM